MRTIEQRIYQFDELSDAAKDRAREWYRNDPYRNDYLADEYRASLQAFEDYCPILDSWKNAFIGELEYRDTNEYIDDHIRGNEYEFFEDGTRYHASGGGVPS